MKKPLIVTDESLCTGCNKCIMVCPIKYVNNVKIVNGERKITVDADRCIGCGECIKTCDHKARHYLNDTERFFSDLDKKEQITVIVAPSFVANQYDLYKNFFGYLKQLGINLIYDVSLGADITVWAYAKFLMENRNKAEFFISQPCPAIVNYIEKYAQNLIRNLIPINSPAINTAIYLKKYKKTKDKIAFLSPCIAKKTEFKKSTTPDYIDYNVTFTELLKHIEKKGINISDYPEANFDHNEAGTGILFSKPGGLKECLLYHMPDIRIKQAEGTDVVYDYLDFLNSGERLNEYDFVDLLSCKEGCNVGAATLDYEGVDIANTPFENEKLSDKRLKNQAKRTINHEEYDKSFKKFNDLLCLDDFITSYEPTKVKDQIIDIEGEELDKTFNLLHKYDYESRKINCYSCGYKTCTDMAIALYNGYNVPSSCFQYNKIELEIQKNNIQDRENYISTVLEHLSESVLVTDKEGLIEYANHKTEEIFGYEVKTYHHNNIKDYIKNINLKKMKENDLYEYVITHKKGHSVVIRLQYNIINVKDKTLFNFIIIDITKEKELDKLKNEFISMISHELRTPLTSIRGALGLVASGALGGLSEKAKSLLDIATNNSIRLVNLINDILDLEKIKAGKMEFNFSEYEIVELIKETISLNEEYSKQFNVQYKLIEHIDKAYVNVDKDKFIQVLTNLLSNAAKFSLPDEIVEIHIERKKNLISTSVINKGEGIPEEAYSKIFKSFSQVDSSNTRQKGGTGLGLNISKNIIQKMGGDIGFTSKVDDKTTFHFELPEIYKRNEKKKVLICEDNKTTAFCIKKMFEQLDYTADIAFSAQETRDLLSKNEYELMTLDLILPDKDGLSLLDEIRESEKTKDLPVIIISVRKADMQVLKQKHKVVSWLEKSFEMKDLEKIVNNIKYEKNRNKVDILYVENDEDILNLIKMTLKDIAKILTVNNLEEAGNIVSENTFDIIILDYKFPDGTCEKLLSSIKSGINKNAKIIIFSAYDESKALSREVDSVILKTNVSNEEFKSCIEKYIRG